MLWVTICNNACTCLYSKIAQKWENVQASVLELAVALKKIAPTLFRSGSLILLLPQQLRLLEISTISLQHSSDKKGF
jgi:hypothetical protein